MKFTDYSCIFFFFRIVISPCTFPNPFDFIRMHAVFHSQATKQSTTRAKKLYDQNFCLSFKCRFLSLSVPLVIINTNPRQSSIPSPSKPAYKNLGIAETPTLSAYIYFTDFLARAVMAVCLYMRGESATNNQPNNETLVFSTRARARFLMRLRIPRRRGGGGPISNPRPIHYLAVVLAYFLRAHAKSSAAAADAVTNHRLERVRWLSLGARGPQRSVGG